MALLFVCILLALVLVGAPLFAIIGWATALCFVLFTDGDSAMIQLVPVVQNMEGLVNRTEFLAIPLFMASGAIMTAGGIATRLVRVMRAAVGWLPGGMAIASVLACLFFAAISGSSVVTLIAVGSIMMPAMKELRYPENFSLGLVTTAGSLGCLVPPSLAMLIYAISISSTTAKVNPQDLFLAGLVPAMFIVGLLAIYSLWVGLKIPGSREKFDWAEFRAATYDAVWALLLPFIVLGGIYGGFYNPSEAGAVAAIYALVVTMVVYRELDWKKLHRTLIEAATLMGSLILIILLALALNDFLALIEVADRLMVWIAGMELGPVGFLLLVNLLLIVIGALMDSISCTLIFAPILAPVAYELYGIDPLHFGVVFVVNMEIGYLMPPVATNLFVSSAVFKKPFGQVVRAVLPTLGITCAALVVIMYVPTLSKAAVNWKTGAPIAESFPWDGKPVVVETPGVDTAVQTGDLGALTQEAMKEASAADAGPSVDGAAGDPKKAEESFDF
jgi:C4-dicarboxylate transporter DctM subunit